MKHLLLLLLSASVVCAAPKKPNIIFILADDYGINLAGCYGSDRFKGKTPNIDALAASGLRFEQCYSMPTCNPSRCVLMTGRYTFRYGNKPSFKTEHSVAKLLKQAGYATGMAGKWRQMADTPGDWGFDEYLTDPEASGYYWEKTYTKNGQTVKTDQPVYCPDVCMEFALGFFKQHRNQPFFFYYPTHLVHNRIMRTPDSKPDTTDPIALYDDNVAYLDKQVGQLVAALDSLGLRERTVIVFAGDNGTSNKHAGKQLTIGGREVVGEKTTMLEGGSRVPLIVGWKGTVAGGRILKDLVDFSDMLPTFADLAVAKLPEGVKIDGHSFAPQLRGEKGHPREWVYVQHNTAPEWYVRDQGFKLTHDGKLFDMSDAPFIEKPSTDDAARQRLQAVLDELKPTASTQVQTGEKKQSKKERKRAKKNQTEE